jgi:enoyl-CoA hydratase/carnithine racemase
MSYQYLRIHDAAGTRIITLNRAEKRNALSVEMMRELIGAFDDISDTRIIVLAAEGKVFSSGHDLAELTGGSEDEYRNIFEICTELMLKLQALPQPVIAEVGGLATAAGCQLVAACDLAIASEDATFATPGVKIGLFCTTPMVPLVRAIGRKRALEMLLTGRSIDARTAAEWGLVNRVVPADQLRDRTLELSQAIASASPYTIGIGKRAFYDSIACDERSAYINAQRRMTENALAGDAQEGISAFLGKRTPVWRGK